MVVYCKKAIYKLYPDYCYPHILQMCSLGAFGIVHKGEMVASDGKVKAVAIKTIKCECVIVLKMLL